MTLSIRSRFARRSRGEARPVALCGALALVAVLCMCLTAGLGAQDKDMPRHKFDRYTQHKAPLINAAGYLNFGPMQFGQRGAQEVSTKEIDAHLQYSPLIWVETAHFRIGSSLPAWNVPTDKWTRDKIRAELERLKEKLPAVNPKTRKLDPWLRLHLFAQRAEDTYTKFQELLGVTDRDFPAAGQPVMRLEGARFMGYGPYLGMKGKFLLLLVEDDGTYTDYLKTYIGRQSRFGQRWHFKDVGSLFYGVSTESDPGHFQDDTALHGNVAFNVSICLLDGFRHYSYELPVWIREALGHWFERQISPRFNTFDQDEGSPLEIRNTWKWQPAMVAMVGSDKFAPFSEAYTWRNYGDIKFNDHIALWSRVDYLIAQGQEPFAKFMFGIKGRVDENWVSDHNDLVGATREALREAYGLNALTLESKWQEWVLENYDRR